MACLFLTLIVGLEHMHMGYKKMIPKAKGALISCNNCLFFARVLFSADVVLWDIVRCPSQRTPRAAYPTAVEVFKHLIDAFIWKSIVIFPEFHCAGWQFQRDRQNSYTQSYNRSRLKPRCDHRRDSLWRSPWSTTWHCILEISCSTRSRSPPFMCFLACFFFVVPRITNVFFSFDFCL